MAGTSGSENLVNPGMMPEGHAPGHMKCLLCQTAERRLHRHSRTERSITMITATKVQLKPYFVAMPAEGLVCVNCGGAQEKLGANATP
eukprot:6053833-Amphidinium_carterae.1